MKEYQKRVIEEEEELDKKIKLLILFINTDLFETISPAEKIRLERQKEIMEVYQEILVDRIKNFD